MNMEIDFNSGKISFSLHYILENIHPLRRTELIESFSCDDAVIKHVAEQLLEGFTESGFSGGTYCSASADGGTPLDQARRRIAKGAGEVALETIEALEKSLRQRDQQIADLHQELNRRSRHA